MKEPERSPPPAPGRARAGLTSRLRLPEGELLRARRAGPEAVFRDGDGVPGRRRRRCSGPEAVYRDGDVAGVSAVQEAIPVSHSEHETG